MFLLLKTYNSKNLFQLLAIFLIILTPHNLSIQFLIPQTENIVWNENFMSGDLSDWEVTDDITNEHSNWFIEKGYLIQDTDIGSKSKLIGTNIIYGKSEWGDHIIRSNIICADDDFMGIIFRYIDNGNYYRFILSSEEKEIRVDKKFNGEIVNLARITEEWEYVKFNVTIFLRTDNIKIYLNDKEYFNLTDSQFSAGKVGFTSISNLGSFIDDITIYSDYKIISNNAGHKFSRGPYLQSVLGNSVTVRWDTPFPSNSVVEYGLSMREISESIDNKSVKKHEVKLEGLQSESVYFYRIKSGELTSEWHSFNSAVKESTQFSFITYGDNQMNFLRHTEICKQISTRDFDFVISCGDVVQNGHRDDWDVEFFDPLKNILTNKPIYAAIGNHELNSENYYINFSNPDLDHENFYSFKYGNSFFIFIDNPRLAYPKKTYYTKITTRSPQYKWLENELASDKAQNAEWLFVISHVPSYVAGSQEVFEGCKETLVPLFEKYGVDFSFSGHVHGYERGNVNGVSYIVTAGGGGAQNKNSSSLLKQVKNFKLVYNFCQININGKSISFRAFDNNNDIIDQFEIVKK